MCCHKCYKENKHTPIYPQSWAHESFLEEVFYIQGDLKRPAKEMTPKQTMVPFFDLHWLSMTGHLPVDTDGGVEDTDLGQPYIKSTEMTASWQLRLDTWAMP